MINKYSIILPLEWLITALFSHLSLCLASFNTKRKKKKLIFTMFSSTGHAFFFPNKFGLLAPSIYNTCFENCLLVFIACALSFNEILLHCNKINIYTYFVYLFLCSSERQWKVRELSGHKS